MPGADDGGAMNDNRTNYGGWTNPMAAPMEQWGAVLRTLTDMWSAFLPAGWPCVPQQIWNPGGVGQAAGQAGSAQPVSVRVSSQRLTEVTATLTPGSEYLPLVAEVPNLTGVSISREGAKVCVELQVAPTQAAGTYYGSIIAAGREVGTLSVSILEPPAASATEPKARRRRAKA